MTSLVIILYDNYISTIARETFISDHRFSSLHSRTPISDLVTLSIAGVGRGDAGKYQCQVIRIMIGVIK